MFPLPVAAMTAMTEWHMTLLLPCIKTCKLSSCKSVASWKSCCPSTLFTLYELQQLIFFHFSKTRAASADPKLANEQQFKLEWTIRVANSSIKMLLVKMNVVPTPAWMKSEMYTAPVQRSAHKTLTQVSCCEGESFYISCRYLRVDMCRYL